MSPMRVPACISNVHGPQWIYSGTDDIDQVVHFRPSMQSASTHALPCATQAAKVHCVGGWQAASRHIYPGQDS